MSMFKIFDVSGSAASAQTQRLNVVASNVANAHAFINYFLLPEVSAALSNAVSYPVANKAALPFVKPEIAKDPSTYLDEATMAKMVAPESFSKEAREAMTSAFTAFKKGS